MQDKRRVTLIIIRTRNRDRVRVGYRDRTGVSVRDNIKNTYLL